jgi:predicted MPP superfamily phosphohydrolase
MIMMIICLVLLLFSVYYVPRRLQRLWGGRRAWPLQLLLFLLLAGFYGVLASGLYTRPSSLIAAVYNGLGLFFIFHVYLFFFLLAAQLMAPLLKRVPGQAVAAAGLALSLGLVGLGFYQAQSFTVTNHTIKVQGLSQPVTIMHISDLHLGAQRGAAYLRAVLAAIAGHNPDIVLYNGDLLDSNIALQPELFALFQGVQAQQYFTTGNHEFYIDTAKALELIKGAGIRILRSEMVVTHGLQLIGLEYMNADRQTYDAHMVNHLTMEEELPKIERSPNLPLLLAHHSPVGMQYAVQGKVDVMLSGHTHGGQLFPGTILTGLRFPMDKGRYQIGDMTLLVSQGAGTFGPWMRLGTFSELQYITLVPAQ